MRAAARAAAVAVAFAVTACSSALEPATPVAAPVPPRDSIEIAIFLIGDAGSQAYDGEPVLRELALQSDSLRPVRQFIVFLGDNVYPRGVPPIGDPNRKDAERRLAAQVLAIRKGSAQGLLVPGNHDWDRQGRDGWNSIRRQDTLVRKFGGTDVRLLPRGGCPGPDVVDLGDHVRIIALDTEWWLHNDVKPYGDASPCPTKTYQDVTDSLAGRAAGQGRAARHHRHPSPAASGGTHGGAFHPERSPLPPAELEALDVAAAAVHRLALSVRPADRNLEPGRIRAEIPIDAPGLRAGLLPSIRPS